MRKTFIYMLMFGFVAVMFASCTTDEDGIVTPDIKEGIHFKYAGAMFEPTTIENSYVDGNMYFHGREEPSQTSISFIVRDKMKEGEYNFANIYNVSMKFLPYDDETFLPVAGKFNLYELDKDAGRLKALFDCVLKSKETGRLIQITDGSINIEY